MTTTDMMCGHCGHTHFSIKYTGDNYRGPDSLIVVCDECGNDSVISVEATIKIDFGPHSDGCLCPE